MLSLHLDFVFLELCNICFKATTIHLNSATLERNGANGLIFTSVITLLYIFLFLQILQNHKGNKAKREGRMLKSPKAVMLEFKEAEVLLGSHLSRLGLKTWPHPSAMLMM